MRVFSRETLIALAANIESREWRRQYSVDNNLPMQNPRASSTDDVECFFSVLRDTVGKDFTLKEVRCCINVTISKCSQQCRFTLDGEK